ncbi:MAG: PH domain-containing protein [Flavobacterium sp.]|nr:PH domain-containing protein [Flavobacterium sp.]
MVFGFVFTILLATFIPLLSSKNLISIIIVLIINLITIGLLLWIIFNTKYTIKNGSLYCKSGPFHKIIPISRIKKISHHKGLVIPVLMKLALSDKGLIISYDYYDEVYISPKEEFSFLKTLLETNPKIQIIKPTNEL